MKVAHFNFREVGVWRERDAGAAVHQLQRAVWCEVDWKFIKLCTCGWATMPPPPILSHNLFQHHVSVTFDTILFIPFVQTHWSEMPISSGILFNPSHIPWRRHALLSWFSVWPYHSCTHTHTGAGGTDAWGLCLRASWSWSLKCNSWGRRLASCVSCIRPVCWLRITSLAPRGPEGLNRALLPRQNFHPAKLLPGKQADSRDDTRLGLQISPEYLRSQRLVK